MNDSAFSSFCDDYMKKGGRFVPGRLQAAMALLERLRSDASLTLADHTVKGGASVTGHETLAKAALSRFNLAAVNKNSGRRSSNLPEWGQPLLDALRAAGFPKKSTVLNDAQRMVADRLRAVLETDPFEVRLEGRTAEAVIADVLDQADQRDRAGAVAQYLVGAKLKLRFPLEDVPVRQFNQRDTDDRRADYQLKEAAIEVALGTPDEKHIQQVRTDFGRVKVRGLVARPRPPCNRVEG